MGDLLVCWPTPDEASLGIRDSGRPPVPTRASSDDPFLAAYLRTSTGGGGDAGAPAAPSSARDVIPSFGKTRYKCVLIVRCERNKRWPISRFDRPSAASWAICSSCAVS